MRSGKPLAHLSKCKSVARLVPPPAFSPLKLTQLTCAPTSYRRQNGCSGNESVLKRPARMKHSKRCGGALFRSRPGRRSWQNVQACQAGSYRGSVGDGLAGLGPQSGLPILLSNARQRSAQDARCVDVRWPLHHHVNVQPAVELSVAEVPGLYNRDGHRGLLDDNHAVLAPLQCSRRRPPRQPHSRLPRLPGRH